LLTIKVKNSSPEPRSSMLIPANLHGAAENCNESVGERERLRKIAWLQC